MIIKGISTPNILTSLRIAMIPVLVIVFYLAPVEWRYLASAIVFSIASVTDWLDGYLARKWGQTTPFGAFLDPVADKLIVAVALVLLVEVHASAILAVPALVIVGREIVVSASPSLEFVSREGSTLENVDGRPNSASK